MDKTKMDDMEPCDEDKDLNNVGSDSQSRVDENESNDMEGSDISEYAEDSHTKLSQIQNKISEIISQVGCERIGSVSVGQTPIRQSSSVTIFENCAGDWECEQSFQDRVNQSRKHPNPNKEATIGPVNRELFTSEVTLLIYRVSHINVYLWERLTYDKQLFFLDTWFNVQFLL